MDNNFELNLAKDKQRICAKIALRRAKRVFALIKGGRKIDKSDLEELLLHFDIYCGIFDDAVKQETEINEAEARRLREFRERQVVNG
jgi:hypothetical protein